MELWFGIPFFIIIFVVIAGFQLSVIFSRMAAMDRDTKPEDNSLKGNRDLTLKPLEPREFNDPPAVVTLSANPICYGSLSTVNWLISDQLKIDTLYINIEYKKIETLRKAVDRPYPGRDLDVILGFSSPLPEKSYLPDYDKDYIAVGKKCSTFFTSDNFTITERFRIYSGSLDFYLKRPAKKEKTFYPDEKIGWFISLYGLDATECVLDDYYLFYVVDDEKNNISHKEESFV